MRSEIKGLTLFVAVVAGLGFSPRAAFADAFSVAYSAAGVQAPASGAYETFGTATAMDGAHTYVSSVTGTYTGTYSISAANQFGGAGGSGAFLQVFGGNSATLTIGKEVNYFGLWFSALDSGNSLGFYEGDALLYSFSAAQFAAAVGMCTGSNPYCGNPNGSGDTPEQFAYINFQDTSGTFNKIVFSQAANGGAFESDNHIVGLNVLTAQSAATPLASMPEPSSLVLLGTGVSALAGAVRRRRS